MITKEQIAHDLAVVVAQTYISDEVKSGEYQETGVEGTAKDALNVYRRVYDLIIHAE